MSTTSKRLPVGKRAPFKNSGPVFHDEAKTNDVSETLIANARKSGSLNISGRGLNQVPDKVWKINILDDTEKKNVSLSLDDNDSTKWWEFTDLQKLVIANNHIMCIPSDIKYLGSLTTLDAHDNQIGPTIPPEISVLEFLQKCDFSHNKIRTLPEGFYSLKRLTDLNICDNELENVDGIGSLNCLRTVDLSKNKLDNLPGEIGFASFLTSLNLSYNMLRTVPCELGNLASLKTLNLSFNRLENIPSICSMRQLQILNLASNKLTSLPDVSECQNLIELYAQHNKLKTLESKTFQLTKIQLLDLRSNKIENLEFLPQDMPYIDRLYLDNNDISSVPDEIGGLKSLRVITLDGNPLRSIRLDIVQRGGGEVVKFLKSKWAAVVKEDPTIAAAGGSSDLFTNVDSPNTSLFGADCASEGNLVDVHKLKASRKLGLTSQNLNSVPDDVFEAAKFAAVNDVNLSKNSIVELNSSVSLLESCLTNLILDFNKLKCLPASLSKCTYLQYLSLQNNSVETLPQEFSELKNLREINFAYNRMSEIPDCLFKLNTLEILIAASNKITEIDPANLQSLKRLAVLDLSNNSISKLPPELGLISQLRSLSLEGNAFRVPNYQVLSQGTEAILRFLRNRIRD